MRRPRFRVRTLLIAVALVALALGGIVEVGRLRRLSMAYRQRAADHGRRERENLRAAAFYDDVIPPIQQDRGDSRWQAELRRNPIPLLLYRIMPRRVAAHHATLRQKYLRAADRPWEAVPPDPPAPTFDRIKPELPPLIIAMSIGLDGLNLGNTPVTDAGLKPIEGWVQLRYLNLSQTKVGDAGLVRLKRLVDLEELNLVGTQVSDAGLAHLKGLAHLRRLDLGGTKVTVTGVRDFARANPKTTITYDDRRPAIFLGKRRAE